MKKLIEKLVNKLLDCYSQMWEDTGTALPHKGDWKTTRTQFSTLKEVFEGLGVSFIYLTTMTAQLIVILVFLLWTFLNAPYSIWKNKQDSKRDLR